MRRFFVLMVAVCWAGYAFAQAPTVGPVDARNFGTTSFTPYGGTSANRTLVGMTTDVLNLHDWAGGLPTGGDDTAAINAALASVLPSTFTATASVAPTGGSGIATGTVTVTGSPGGTLAVGDTLTGGGFVAGTVITDYDGGTGGAGTYFVTPSQTATSTTVTVQPPATKLVYAPAGTYFHANNIELISACLVGDGDSTVFAATSNNGTDDKVAIHMKGGSPCLKSVQLTTNYTGSRQGGDGLNHAVYVNYAVNYLVRDVHVVGTEANQWPAACILQDHGINGVVETNTCYWTLADAYHICCDSGNVTESLNYANHPGDDCYPVVSYTGDVANVRKVTIVANRCDNGGARGLVVEGGSEVTYVANIIDNAFFCMMAASDSGQKPVDHIVYGDNIIMNCGVSGNQAATVIYGTGSSNIVADIDMHDNHIVAAKALCAYIGGSNAAADTLRVTFHHNECDGSGTILGYDAIDIGGATDVDVTNNIVENWTGGGVKTNGTANAGALAVNDNKFVAISGGADINLTSTPGFTNVTIIGNHQGSGTPGMVNTTAAFTTLTVEGNVGGGTQTVTGPTDGYWDNPAASFTHR